MSDNIHPVFDKMISREQREIRLGQKSKVFWMTGLSGSGKSTIAAGVERVLFEKGYLVQMLDGDNVRSGLNSNLGFTIEDRQENIRRIAELAKLYNNSGIVTICSFISPTKAIRNLARGIIGVENFCEVFIDTPLKVCESRDVKGLYKKARTGEIKGFTGIDSPYEAPENPHLTIFTPDKTIEQSIQEAVELMLPQIKVI